LLSLLLLSVSEYPSSKEIKSNILWCLNNILRTNKFENNLKIKDFDIVFEILEKIIQANSVLISQDEILPRAPSLLLDVLSCLDIIIKKYVSQALSKKIFGKYFGIVEGLARKIDEIREEKGINYFLNFICFLTVDCKDEQIKVNLNKSNDLKKISISFEQGVAFEWFLIYY
jgi:hypothetical protein